jgi:catechol 2,3-dioxygenase-like lactoylglutathione lyase family enzyme
MRGFSKFRCSAAFGLLAVMASAAAASSDEKLPRPRITGIDHVTIYVTDLEKSRQFYAGTLGFAASCAPSRSPESCLLVLPSRQRVLLKPAPVSSGNLKSWIVEIAFATDNLAQMRKYLTAHGFAPEAAEGDSEPAKSFRVHDPEGNVIAFVEGTDSKSNSVAAPKQIGTHLIHAGFVVKDRAAENRFYVDLLGFRLYWYGGFKDVGIDWYELQVPDGPDWIEYMLNIAADADHKELGIQNHFSFGVKDVHAAAAQLRERGLKTFDGPEVGRDGKDSLDAYDPDGTRVEIMEFTPKQKPCCHPYSAEHPKP